MVVFNELFMGVPQRVSNIDTRKHTHVRRRLIFSFLNALFFRVLASFSVRFMVVYVILNEIFITHFFVSLFIYLFIFFCLVFGMHTNQHTNTKRKKKT